VEDKVTDLIIFNAPTGIGVVRPRSEADFKYHWELMTAYGWKLRTGTYLTQQLLTAFACKGYIVGRETMAEFVSNLPSGIVIPTNKLVE
jgi:hypothetical protein